MRRLHRRVPCFSLRQFASESSSDRALAITEAASVFTAATDITAATATGAEDIITGIKPKSVAAGDDRGNQ